MNATLSSLQAVVFTPEQAPTIKMPHASCLMPQARRQQTTLLSWRLQSDLLNRSAGSRGRKAQADLIGKMPKVDIQASAFVRAAISF